jgi:DNA invertase Pin-like site-specific DNA recombinase
MSEQLQVHAYTDENDDALGARPAFERLLSGIRDAGERRGIWVVELNRLFRSHRDRARIDELLEEDKVAVMTLRENIDTLKPGGRHRYRRAADLTELAYEGGAIVSHALTRAEIIDEYVSHVLSPWLDLYCASQDGTRSALDDPAVADVRARLHALAGRWDAPDELDPLLALFLEVAEWNEPKKVPVRLRALVTVGVRNSMLEDLHLLDHESGHAILDDDWRRLTTAAAYYLAPLPSLPSGTAPADTADPFGGLDLEFPFAWIAFAALARLQLGETATIGLPNSEPPPFPEGEFDAELHETRRGVEIVHAMDDRLSTKMAEAIRAVGEGNTDALQVASLKHFSRNPQKLFRIVNIVLAHGGTILTNNVTLSPDSVTRAKLGVTGSSPVPPISSEFPVER